MSAARVSSRALKALTSTSTTQTRSLSMTGPATFSSLLTSDKPARGSNAPRQVNIPVPDTNDTGKPVRHFNTSRSLKAVNDSSTIDFMYIPEFNPDITPGPVEVRVPILPWAEGSWAAREQAAETEPTVMLPTIHTVAADGTHIHAPAAMSDMTDSGAIDFQGMASSVAAKLATPVNENAGMVSTIWRGFIEDVLGPKHPQPART